MEALVERLSQLDSDAEGAVRIVMFYDTLIRRRVDLPALVRASANVSECVAAVTLHGTEQTVRMSCDGQPIHATAAPASATAPVMLDDEEIGTVWLERPGPSAALDQLLLDRLAIAVAAVVERYEPARTTMADPALVELVVSADSDEASRARALRLLGFAAYVPVRVVAVRTTLRLNEVGSAICPQRLVKAAALGDVGVILATTVDISRMPAGVSAGIGDGGSLPQSWRQARTALHFTGPREPIIHYGDLGALALLADTPVAALTDNVDVRALSTMASNRDDMNTLDTYCVAGSVRRAAELLHLHHSSVARRLRQIGNTLGFELTDPGGLVRARVALAAWRLQRS